MSEYRQVQGEIKLLQRRNEFLYDVELFMLSASSNRNSWKYPVNEAVARLFLGKPLLTAYIGDGTIVGDGHNFVEYFDENGEIRGDFTAADAERIVGSLSEDPADIRVVERDGDTWIVGRGTLWEWYCGQLCEQIRGLAEQGRTMPVSIETLVSESHMDGDIEVMDALPGTALTSQLSPTGSQLGAMPFICLKRVPPHTMGNRLVSNNNGYSIVEIILKMMCEDTKKCRY